jgi:hypothetical protein
MSGAGVRASLSAGCDGPDIPEIGAHIAGAYRHPKSPADS